MTSRGGWPRPHPLSGVPPSPFTPASSLTAWRNELSGGDRCGLTKPAPPKHPLSARWRSVCMVPAPVYKDRPRGRTTLSLGPSPRSPSAEPSAVGRAHLPRCWGHSERSSGWPWCCSRGLVQSEQNIQKSSAEAQSNVRRERLCLVLLEGPCHQLSGKPLSRGLKPTCHSPI